MKLFHIFEYGKIRCEGESSSGDFPQDLHIPKDDFDDIWDFVLEQYSLNNDSSYIVNFIHDRVEELSKLPTM